MLGGGTTRDRAALEKKPLFFGRKGSRRFGGIPGIGVAGARSENWHSPVQLVSGAINRYASIKFVNVTNLLRLRRDREKFAGAGYCCLLLLIVML
jgi:hypothetical protein